MSILGIKLMNWFIIFGLYFIPAFMILRKAGYSGWWVLTLLIPFVNLIMPWAFAISRWPVEEDVRRARDSARAEVALLQRQIGRMEATQHPGANGT